MTRKEFVQMCSLLSISLPFQRGLAACNRDSNGATTGNPEEVIIIGAGAGGLTAGYQLGQLGVNYRILEASNTYGGRMKRTTDFADFPIPLGAEWLHVRRGIFDEIVNDNEVEVAIQTVPYDQKNDVALVDGEKFRPRQIGFTIDQKFISASWFDFFEQYVVPSVSSKIEYSSIVKAIDYSADRIVVTTTEGRQYSADSVIVTVPVKLLQEDAIAFTPALPDSKLEAINGVTVWDGCKAFIAFEKKFYPTLTGVVITPEEAGQKLYYDAAYGQQTDQNILGLFAVGKGTSPLIELGADERIAYMLAELDDIFEGQASPNYIKHIFQNWNAEPFARGAYIQDSANWRHVRTLGRPIDGKLYFAGDSYTNGLDWSSVHAAARSAIIAVNRIMR